MERSLDVRTGEAIALEYQLAGAGSRFLAVALDGLAQLAVFLLLALAASWAVRFLRFVPAKFVHAAGIAATSIALFLIFIGWFIVFEAWWGGRTPGKRALGIRVVRDGGFPLDWGAAVIRNLVRLAELALGFYALSALSALLSPENKRLGDYAAGTIVVRDRVVAPLDLDAYLAAPARADTGLRPADRVLVGRYLARRATLDAGARAQLATTLAARIRPTLRAAYNNLDDEELLAFLLTEA